MALKDWKRNKKFDLGWKKGRKGVNIYTDRNAYSVHIFGRPSKTYDVYKTFKTMYDAMGFAEAYMRRH